MRAETLSHAEVVGFLNEQFVIGWSNLLPELYGNADPNAPPPKAYNSEHLRSVPEGAGGGNIRCYFCNAEGKIVHQVVGYWKPERFLEETRFALALLTKSPAELARVQESHQQELQA